MQEEIDNNKVIRAVIKAMFFMFLFLLTQIYYLISEECKFSWAFLNVIHKISSLLKIEKKWGF